MAERTCHGLPVDWLDGWLAAVGSTVLVPGMKLRWSDDPLPVAILLAPGEGDPSDYLLSRLPSQSDVDSWPIARHLDGHSELKWDVDLDTWKDRAALARRSPDGWMLAALYTDLQYERTKRQHTIGRGQFATPMPKGGTIHDRLRKLVPAARDADVSASLAGNGLRISANGLGFDVGRVGSLADDTEMLVDPLIELLAFYAMAVFPVRGNGRADARQRGWAGRRGETGAFRWPAWSEPLDVTAIDALLDAPDTGARRLGVTGWWRVVPFESRGTSDVTRAYGSLRCSP